MFSRREVEVEVARSEGIRVVEGGNSECWLKKRCIHSTILRHRKITMHQSPTKLNKPQKSPPAKIRHFRLIGAWDHSTKSSGRTRAQCLPSPRRSHEVRLSRNCPKMPHQKIRCWDDGLFDALDGSDVLDTRPKAARSDDRAKCLSATDMEGIAEAMRIFFGDKAKEHLAMMQWNGLERGLGMNLRMTE